MSEISLHGDEFVFQFPEGDHKDPNASRLISKLFAIPGSRSSPTTGVLVIAVPKEAFPDTTTLLKYLNTPSSEIPANAEYLIYLLLRSRDSKVIARELEEMYFELVDKQGARKAAIWYWSRVICNIFVYWYKPVFKLASVTGIGSVIRHISIVKEYLRKAGFQ